MTKIAHFMIGLAAGLADRADASRDFRGRLDDIVGRNASGAWMDGFDFAFTIWPLRR